MSVLQEIQKLAIKKKVPDLRPGYTVRVHQLIKEGEKERVQIFEGIIIAINSGYGADKTFTVRKIVEGVGVEKIFPLHLPTIEKIEVKKESKVRRAKLYYMRDLEGKSARLKESFLAADTSEAQREQSERQTDSPKPQVSPKPPEISATPVQPSPTA